MFHLIPLVLLFTVLCLGEATERSVELYPSNGRAVFEGHNASFNCTSYLYDSIQWALDQNLTNFLTDLRSETMYSEDETDDKRRFSTLTIFGEPKYNGSTVTCIGNNVFSSNSYSIRIDSIMYVQGLPSEVLNFQGTNITSTGRLQFTWSPPYHVPGLTCCNNYSINITNIDSGDILVDNRLTTQTIITIDVSTQHVCSLYLIKISAFNDLGEGEVMETRWSLGGYFETDKATEMLGYNTEMTDLTLGVNVTIDGYCLNNLDNITVFVECEDVPRILNKTNNITIDKRLNTTQRSIGLIVPETHHNRICSYDVALENTVDFHGTIFSTHNVRSVNVTFPSPDSVCIACDYINNSPALGCVLVVSRTGIDRSKQYSKNISVTDTEGCLELSQGRYRLQVFDWLEDGGRGYDSAYSQFIDIIESANSTTTNQGSLNSGAIAGICFAVIFVVFIAAVIIVILVVILVKITRHNVETDGSKSCGNRVDLGGGEQVTTYKRLMDILDEQNINQWDYRHVKYSHGIKNNTRYILITQNNIAQ